MNSSLLLLKFFIRNINIKNFNSLSLNTINLEKLLSIVLGS